MSQQNNNNLLVCSSCKDNQKCEILCIDIKCENKQFICIKCQETYHSNHKTLKMEDYIQGIVNSGKSIEEKLPNLLKSQYETNKLFDYSKKQFDNFNKQFKQTEEEMLNLFQFNKDITSKNINKDISTIESLKYVYEELHIQNNEKKINWQSIIQEQRKFINRLSIEQLENPQALSSDLFKKVIDGVHQKNIMIDSFNNVVKTTFEKFIKQINESLQDLKSAQIDIVDFLDSKLQELRHPDQYILKIHKKNEQPGHFSTLGIQYSNISDVQNLQKQVSDFYNIEQESITLRKWENHEQLQQNENLFEYIKTKRIYCQIDTDKAFNEKYINLAQNLKEPIIIGVSGATRSGKGTLSNHLRIKLDAHIISQDMFFDVLKIYKDLGGNWETPDALKWDEIKEAFKKEIQKAKNNNKKVILAEGFLLFSKPEVLDMFNIRLFLQIEQEHMYLRRMRTKPVPEDYFQNCIVKGYKEYEQEMMRIKDEKQINILQSILPSQEIFKQAMEIIQNYCSKN